ncbi:MAG: hypothetical protein Q7T86_03180 [Hyphomicrobiaceae bacterium]|nr:hypothetical protein [Hyphomicrobiaceae bacterium]
MVAPSVKPAAVIDGVAWYDYSFSYDWEGHKYGFEICARSEDEARARLKRLPLARFEGACMRIAYRGPWTHLTVRVMCWWMNLRQRAANTGA